MRLLTAAQLRQRLDDEEGMSLVEVLVAVMLLTVAILALASTSVTAMKSVRVGRDRDLATSAASSALESVRALDFDDVGLGENNTFIGDTRLTGSLPNLSFAHDDVNAELLVLGNSGLEPYVCSPTMAGTCWFDYDAYSARHTVATYVTWFDDPTVTGDKNGKRVTVMVSWRDGESTHEVRQSTVVAQSERGVGVPDFTVTPADVGSPVPPGRAVCFNHTLENFGPADTFDLWYEKPSGASSDPYRFDEKSIVVTYKGGLGSPKGWIVHAWMGPNAWTEAGSWKTDYNEAASQGLTTPPPSDDYMQEMDTDPPLEGPVASGVLGSVPKDTSTQLAICYRPKKDQQPSSGEAVTLKPLVRSEFWASLVGNPETSPASTEGVLDLAHTVNVTGESRAVYLDEGVVDQPQPYTMTDVPPPTRELPDFAGDFDSDVPGYGMRKPSNNAGTGEAVVWRDNDSDVTGQQFTTAQVELWTSWDEAILFATTPDKANLAFTASLCVWDTNAAACVTGTERLPSTSSVVYGGIGSCDATGLCSYLHDTPGWISHTLNFSWGATAQQVGSGQELQLRFQCQSGNRELDEDCHVAFGTATFPARIDLIR